MKLHSMLTDMSVIVQQALHKRNASCRLEEDDHTIPAPRTLPSGTLAVVLFHAEFKAYSFHAPLKLPQKIAVYFQLLTSSL